MYSLDRRTPELPEEATEEEQRLAAKYTRVLVIDDKKSIPYLIIGLQSFGLGDVMTRKKADWYCWMASKALKNLIKEELNT